MVGEAVVASAAGAALRWRRPKRRCLLLASDLDVQLQVELTYTHTTVTESLDRVHA